ncbi:MAG: pyruvate, phosphate dikinase [Myxococcota bacterium]
MSDKRVYFFGAGQADGGAQDRQLLGGKGANLAEMTRLGLPVPPGFTVTTKVCNAFYKEEEQLPEGLDDEMFAALRRVEELMGAQFGDPDNPLLVSVRSGSAISMPGMMDTILNLGLNDKAVEGLAKRADPRFAYDSYRRLIAMYGEIVLGVKESSADFDPFEEALAAVRRKQGVENDSELTAESLLAVIEEFKVITERLSHRPFPQDPRAQLLGATKAVFKSWFNDRAAAYRRINDIPHDLGTAVTVQTMVFGNMGDDCGTGVAFTRDPNSGAKRFFGEYLLNAQGEDVVAGIRTPRPINDSGEGADPSDTLEQCMPDVYRELDDVRHKLETHYRDMQDIEFTIQRKKLFLLQTRNGKRTAGAAVRIAVDLAHEGMISKGEAVQRVTPGHIDHLLHPMLDPKARRQTVAKGLPASPGAATGRVVFSADEAAERGARGESVILVRVETSPEDVAGMHYSAGVLTSRGGMTSHAAVVARGMGKSCVVGCAELSINYELKQAESRGQVIRADDLITIDGASGEVMIGEVATVQSGGSAQFDELMTWVDEIRRMKVRTNADTPHDAATAREFGAEGIGLCRTEHMFFDANRITAMREMIMAESETGRRAALSKLAPMQRADFEGIFRAMDGLPVTIRLLDPPLHEFLPRGDSEMESLAAVLSRDPDALKAKAHQLHEVNPMLGLRGCRLGLKHPEIYEMQTRAILEAAIVVERDGVHVLPEIMVPLVSTWEELAQIRKLVETTAEQVFAEQQRRVEFQVGTMIEIPRAALTADEIALHADFFSFGTNDLTQMTFGISRDDSAGFLPDYVERGLVGAEPFQVLDAKGVGALVKWASERGRNEKPRLKLGICGEHGGEPNSVAFCHQVGLDYVSCSPFRVPVARLAAAQASLRDQD